MYKTIVRVMILPIGKDTLHHSEVEMRCSGASSVVIASAACRDLVDASNERRYLPNGD